MIKLKTENQVIDETRWIVNSLQLASYIYWEIIDSIKINGYQYQIIIEKISND